MALNYKIRRFDANFGQISVEYFSEDGLFKLEYAIDLPIKDDNTYPVGDELLALIVSMAPTWHYERTQKIHAGVTNSAAIQNLVEPHPVPAPQIEEPSEEIVPE